MEEKAKVTAAPTIAEQCGIKHKEVSQRVMQVLESMDTVISEP